VLVTVIVGFSVLEFRMRPGEENLDGPADPRQHAARGHLDAIPAILIVGLVTYAYVVMRDIEQAPASRHERVVSRSPASSSPWTFAYNEGGKRFTTRSSTCPRASR
jgi:cytochrome c oxidase subunit 2